MTDIYSHWSDAPVTLDRSRRYEPHEYRLFKPTGLWFDVNEDWKRWCDSESFMPDHLRYRHILLLDKTNILELSSPTAIDWFTEEYVPAVKTRLSDMEILWHKVCRSYDGIIISPYCWERRMTQHTFWYYGWDCASGCIWNLDAVKGFALVGSPERETA